MAGGSVILEIKKEDGNQFVAMHQRAL